MARRTRSTFRRRAAARPRTTSRTTTRTTTTTLANRGGGGAAKYILPAVLVGALTFFVARRVLAAPPPVSPPVLPPPPPQPPQPPQQGTRVENVPVPNYPAGTVTYVARAREAGHIRGAPDVRSARVQEYVVNQELTMLNVNDIRNVASAEAPQGWVAVRDLQTGRTGWAAIHKLGIVNPAAPQMFAPQGFAQVPQGFAATGFVPYGYGYRHYGR